MSRKNIELFSGISSDGKATFNYKDVRNMEKENINLKASLEELKTDNLQWKTCHDQRESQLDTTIEKLGKLREHSYNLLEKLKCIENILNYEINLLNYEESEVEVLQDSCSEAYQLISIIIEQMESWK